MYVSFDIKTGREYCGILQLSAEMVRVELKLVETKKGPSMSNIRVPIVPRSAIARSTMASSTLAMNKCPNPKETFSH